MKAPLLVAVVALALVVVLVVTVAAVVGQMIGGDPTTGTGGCLVAGPAGGLAGGTRAGPAAGGMDGYTAEQLSNAAVIVAVGKQLAVPVRGQVIAIATALQESGLRNLNYGDRDSLGLFQQRPSQGWGTRAEVTDPAHAATSFYRALLAVRGWEQLSLSDAAQAVQRSAFPNAYARHEPAARAIAAAVGGATCLPPGTPNGRLDSGAARAVAFAHAAIGQPYVWGGDGPADGGGFDCSGLTVAAWATGGVTLPRTAQTQYDTGPLIAASDPLQPGDLIFYGTPARVHHVGIYVGGGQMVHAPDRGQTVRLAPYRYPGDDFLAASRPTSQLRNPR
ncbi:C40 family peptidase [Pseudonocardia sp. CA-107938]|uniref:C40 family peptidase n=1 Tax=Pseudonocardia sp. CA-107938 TaxID=3240021 RepID=UPI003D902763